MKRTRNGGEDCTKGLQALEKTAGFVTIDPASEMHLKAATHDIDGEAVSFPDYPEQGAPKNSLSESESQITITHPGVIEDLIEQSEKRVEKVLMKRLIALSEN